MMFIGEGNKNNHVQENKKSKKPQPSHKALEKRKHVSRIKKPWRDWQVTSVLHQTSPHPVLADESFAIPDPCTVL